MTPLGELLAIARACKGCGQDFSYTVKSCRKRVRCDSCERKRAAKQQQEWKARTGWVRPSRAKEISV